MTDQFKGLYCGRDLRDYSQSELIDIIEELDGVISDTRKENLRLRIDGLEPSKGHNKEDLFTKKRALTNWAAAGVVGFMLGVIFV